LNVLETTVLDDKWMDMSLSLETKDEAPCEFIARMTDLLSIPQGNLKEKEVSRCYCIAFKEEVLTSYVHFSGIIYAKSY
jgi:hypothetical protein